MGYPTQQQKVDYLFKKIGFTKTKTGVAEDQTSGFSGDTKKAPPNEAIASPLIVPGSSVWSDSSFITATPPTSSTAYVGVYSTATAYRMTVDTTVANERTFIARQTWGNPSSAIEGDWIDTQFGADYLVKVYKNDPSVGIAGIDYFDLSAAGTSGKDDVWFFDYSSGVLNFNGEDLDGQLSGITTSNIYIVGYRYIGRKGIQPPAGIGTFHDLVVSNNLSVGGISTFNGDVNVATHAKVKVGTGLTFHFNGTNTLYSNTSNVLHIIENSGQRESWSSKLMVGVTTVFVPQFRINHNSAVEAYYANGGKKLSTSGIGITVYGQLDTTTLNVAGVSTFGGIIEGIAGENKIPSLYANYSNLPNAGTYHGMFAHVHATQKGYFAHAGGWYELVNKESNGRVGTGTETYHIGNLNVTGITTLGSIGISTGLITGPAVTYIDPATVGDNTGTLVVKGNLQVDGTQTTVNSSTMTVTDKNIELAIGAANDAAADGGGITVKSGDGDKTWQWVDATDSWTSSEHIRIPDDKVFGFASDTNTFISRPSGDQIAFTNGGTESMRIFGYGQVLIADGVDRRSGSAELTISGSSSAVLADNSPLYNQSNPCFLHLSNANNSIDASETGIIFHNTFAASGNVALYSKKTGQYASDLIYRFRTGSTASTERVRITSTGRVGIGTTVPFGANAGLEVYKATNNASINVRSGGAGAYLYLDSNSNGYYGVQLSTGSGANPKWFVGGYGSNDLNIQSTGGMVSGNKVISIHSSGNVGIGTNVMGAGGRSLTLAHVGNCTFTIRSGASSNGNIYFADGTSGTAQYMGMIEYNQTSNRMSFHTNGDTSNSKLRILSNGNVGISSESPGHRLDVAGAIRAHLNNPTLFLQNISSGGAYTNRIFFGDGSTFGKGSIIYENETGGENYLRFKVGGNTGNNIERLTIQGSGTGNVGIGSAIPSAKLDVVGSGKFSGNLAVVGVSTFSAGTVKVTKSVQISENLNVTGIATFSNSIVIPPGYGGNFGNINIGITGNNEIDTDTGNLILDSAGGTINIDDGVTVAGVSTFSDNLLIDSNSAQINLKAGTSGQTGAINWTFSTTGTPYSSISLPFNTRITDGFIIDGDSYNVSVKTDGFVKLYSGGNIKLNTNSNGINVTGLTETDTLTTGNATFTGTVSAGSTTGTDGYYLKSTGIGVTWAAFPSSRTTSTQTATAGQTSFNFSYNIGFVDVFINGVKLPESEFTANNGSTIVLDDAAFANDTLEFISLNTIPVTSGGGATNLDGLSDVNITSAKYGQTLRYNGVKFVNDFHPHATTTSTSQVSITNLDITEYRSAEYLIQVTEGTKYHVTKIIAIHDGTNVTFNEYGTITTSTPLATFSVDINSGIMRLLATPASTNSTSFKVKFDAIAV